jgi:hypothetical protein
MTILLPPGIPSLYLIHLNLKEFKENLQPDVIVDFILTFLIINMMTY